MKRDAKSYMATYMRAYRHTRSARGKGCACGAPAVRMKCSEWICERCDALETVQAQLEFRSTELRELAGRKTQGGWRTRERVRPVTSLAERYWDSIRAGANQLAVQVLERANEIVVVAHGEYHLSLGGRVE